MGRGDEACFFLFLDFIVAKTSELPRTAWPRSRPRTNRCHTLNNHQMPISGEDGEDDAVQCNSVEELFALPTKWLPILYDGNIAYRDATRNEYGALPRAKVVYKPGYAIN